MPQSIRDYDGKASTAQTDKASLIVEYAHITADSMLDAFQTLRQARQAKGTPTDEEQDILRSMLVFAGAAIDSSAKQLARDCLPVLARDGGETREKLEDFSSRRLRGMGDSDSANRFMVRVLMHQNAEEAFIDEFVNDLTSGSLQSVEGLHRICEAFGILSKTISKQIRELRPVFEARNDIIHEMDMDFESKNRNRRSRTRAQMVNWTNTALAMAEHIVDEVDARVGEYT